MESQQEPSHPATNPVGETAADPRGRADAFVREETAFHLGFLPTEQSHPLTRTLSEVAADSPELAVDQLFSVDRDIAPVARRVVLTPAFQELVAALAAVAHGSGRVCFSGCGSTGRLAILLEEMWRRALEGSGHPERADAAVSIMTGGDRALIRSVENFEDYATFGARQVADLGLSRGDLMIAISEGGETSSVIGSARAAVDRGMRVFFVYNNPRTILEERIDRSRDLIRDPAVTSIDLFTGPMALSGSTRMQATTAELLVVGMAMEEALGGAPAGPDATGGDGTDTAQRHRLDRVDAFARLVADLAAPPARSAIARFASMEADLYRRGGRITYFADRHLLDIFSDTTERSPTFKLPPFRPLDDRDAAVSWSFAKNPRVTTAAAWRRMLRRDPRGLEWTAATYREMAAPAALVAHPPQLGLREIERYPIGMETDPSRWNAPRAAALAVRVTGEHEDETGVFPDTVPPSAERWGVTIGRDVEQEPTARQRIDIPVTIPTSTVRLFHHLAVKLVFNTMSTATMAIVGRVRGNWMIQVDPTNKKLIDRASRIIAELAGISYAEACRQLYVSIAADADRAEGADEQSPVVTTLARLGIC